MGMSISVTYIRKKKCLYYAQLVIGSKVAVTIKNRDLGVFLVRNVNLRSIVSSTQKQTA